MPRKTETKDLGAVTIRVTQLKNRDALRTFTLACRIFGEVGVQLLAEFATDMIGGKAIDPSKGVQVITTAIMGLAQANPDDVDDLADALLAGVCEVKVEGAWVQIPEDRAEARALMDEVFPSVFALIGALRFALSHNFLPTFAGLTTGDDSNQSGTEESTTPKTQAPAKAARRRSKARTPA